MGACTEESFYPACDVLLRYKTSQGSFKVGFGTVLDVNHNTQSYSTSLPPTPYSSKVTFNFASKHSALPVNMKSFSLPTRNWRR